MNTSLWSVYIFLFKCVGLWPTQHRGLKKILIRLLFWLHFNGTVILLILFEITYLLMSVNENFMEFVKTLGTTIYHLICATTMMFWLVERRTIEELFTLLNRKSFMKMCNGSKNRMFVTESFARAKFWSLAMLYCFLLAAFSSLGFSYIGILLFPEEVYRNGTYELFRIKPYHSYTFLNLDEMKYFIIDVSFQFYAISYMTLGFLFIDCFCLSSILHVTEQLKIINSILEEVDISASYVSEYKEILYECIHESALLIRMNDLLEDLINKPLLIRYASITLAICCIVYITPLEQQKMKLFGYALFAILCTVEPLILSLLSQNLQEQFLEISKSAYAMNWEEADILFRKTLIFLMQRMQKPIYITVGKFMPANTQLFLGIMKISYSFHTLISKNN